MKKRIVFVDDERHVLDALRRMLRGMRDQWEMTFVSTGEQALETMGKSPQDVIVTDMRMPGMDGVQLLNAVRERFPGVIRIILSGHSDTNMALQSVRHAHQYLLKPCGAEEFKATVDRAMNLKDVFLNDAVKTVVAKIETLPSMPRTYLELMAELRREEPSLRTIGELINQDVGMSANILKLVNSAFFGLRTHVSSPVHAVNLLGTEIIKALIISLRLFSRFDMERFPGFSLDLLWKHSLTTGLFAKTIAQVEGRSNAEMDDCYISGLLHDVGKLLLATNFEATYQEVLRRSRSEGRTVHDMENTLFSATHAEIGAYLLGLWGLPESVVTAIFFHHAPPPANPPGFSTLLAVHAANSLEHELVVFNAEYAPHPMDLDFLKRAGQSGRVETWRIACQEKLTEEYRLERETPLR
ncbi:response regulator [Desulfolutivibrio sulfoxidireducens]|uniref:response regulator n=1 Tax=Desulfolutivibrio sulfoxidireducens TaxID=2773299 RepID=UPI00159E15FA|nr:response regulator [Desulfolutivibrio sulfoxidireducens]QLA17674.1 HDOD domain-containing protein [Desulfolutivibrio sulfoxidireducens]QLA21243.1 HDOD domain-containing protein [Desulfolutivibrio sulfoxidireducens]